MAEPLYNLPQIKTGRLLLRPLSLEDAPVLLKCVKDPDVTRYMPWEAFDTLRESADFIKNIAGRVYRGEGIYYGVEEDGRLIGMCAATKISRAHRRCDVGYFLGREYWGKGYMSEALSALIDRLYETTRLERISGIHVKDNPVSGRVMQRAGMLKEGTLRHHYHFDGKWHDGISYSITRDMWMKSKRRLKVRVNSQEDLKRLARVRCFVLDMDGTIYLEDQLLEGSREFLDYIADEDIRALFLTNNSSKCAQDYVEKLLSMGIGALRQDVLTSGEAAADYVRREYGAVRVYVMGNESLKDELRGAGIEVVEDRPDIVVAGFDTTMSYRSMTVVCDLMRQGLPLIATHPDFNCPVQGGFVPDLGAMLAFIEASTGKRPDVVVGKPHEEIIRCIMHRTGLSKDHLAIVGDRLYTDIATGANAGILSVLMLTGETKMQDLETSDVQPDLVFENMQELRSVLAKAHRQ